MLAITTSGAAAYAPGGVDREIAISPDGRRVAYVGANGTDLRARARSAGTDADRRNGWPRGLFFSPDGQWIGFFDASVGLRRVAVTGGSAITVCRIAGLARGAAWGGDGVIVFANNDPASGLFRCQPPAAILSP